MGQIKNKALFFTTSPRTPEKMIPEIRLLHEQFQGVTWNENSQVAFINALANCDFFEGNGSPKNKALSARDRITRAPKALGFVDLKPVVSLTPAGHELVYGKHPQEVFLRQLMKFQLPSPYHRENKGVEGAFWVRPYLEIMRLIRELGSITFDEFKIFALQLTDYRLFEKVKSAVLAFRAERELHIGRYKHFAEKTWSSEIESIYSDRIASGETRTRQTKDASLSKFIKTQKSNLRDYTDACFRYLRYTGLIQISHKGRSISFFQNKLIEVDYLLQTVERNPMFLDNADDFKAQLFDVAFPALYTDSKENIIDIVMRLDDFTRRDLTDKTVEELKDIRDALILKKREAVIDEQVEQLKSYSLYSEIDETFNDIDSGDLYDAPLMLEWNTWRAMTMLDGGKITGNFRVDDVGEPMSTAAGNRPDIECDYGDFVLSVEVTMQSGQRQFESEGESVARHFGKLRVESGKEAYCLFIAPTLNPTAVTYFYGLNKINLALYGGKTNIIPLDLDQFRRLID
ncbi:MAG: AlwI family type II restriction endonuclease, partial [Oscillospiraceae bacterium]|nr:AlwI family type II restriction endonuclease [Oscillospiraceae bacterium]